MEKKSESKVSKITSGAKGIGTLTYKKFKKLAPSSSKRARAAGRPKGTYKYGIPIQEYKKQQARKKALYNVYQQEQIRRLRSRGLTKDQIENLQEIRTEEQFERPVPQQQVQKRRQLPDQFESVADDELEFRRFLAQRTISPNTQQMMDDIRRIQNKAKTDNIEQQRRHFERNLIRKRMSMFRAHENMVKTSLDFTGVNPEENILFAPNTFVENPEDNILRQKRLNVLQSREGGNNLKFF